MVLPPRYRAAIYQAVLTENAATQLLPSCPLEAPYSTADHAACELGYGKGMKPFGFQADSNHAGVCVPERLQAHAEPVADLLKALLVTVLLRDCRHLLAQNYLENSKLQLCWSYWPRAIAPITIIASGTSGSMLACCLL